MQQKFGECKQCNKNRPINAKGICPDCTYFNKHSETRFEAQIRKQKEKPKKIYSLKRKPLKMPKNTIKVNGKLKQERLEKRRGQIELDEKTYEEVFNTNPNFCEETNQPLNDEFRDDEGNIIARWQYSHILSKAAFPEFRNNPKNFNRLSLESHQQWEFGDRTKMKIYEKNQKTIEELLKERNEKSK